MNVFNLPFFFRMAYNGLALWVVASVPYPRMGDDELDGER